jgi:hypothetical protein
MKGIFDILAMAIIWGGSLLAAHLTQIPQCMLLTIPCTIGLFILIGISE